ncbi:MAG: PAS domain-containing protein [Actinobacteria bacterium]|nr:PAS domain-containing protein [Actinomycetota bacterium]
MLEGLGSSFKAIADASFDSVMITAVAQNNEIIYANEAFETLTGYKVNDVIGKDPAFLQGPATDAGTIDRLREDLGADRQFAGRTINYRADGSPFIMHWRIVPVRAGGGDVTHHVAIQRVIVS